ncbi:glycosyltransferase family 39 protein [Dyella sp. C9]|uniref:glycosyltransferase family 39 protein n=1 Tax=Dyella sp. C9 TaxID=2202154 RepID=UPI0013008B85|nr:glycosyltransferase family 39 protein [Dyella sp. C9]
MTDTTQAPARWQGVIYGLIALIACIAAFIGLSASSLWIDELFTVHLINHHDGLAEVLRRALTDTHPPLYYFVLYSWTQLAGLSDWALRVPSAVFAVLAVVFFAAGTRRVLSPAAIGFACAVGSLSTFWFDQSQNTRSYALCMMLAALLLWCALSLRQRIRTRADFPLAHSVALGLLTLVASLTHAYLLLASGMVLCFLLLGTSSWRLRASIVVTGLLVLAINAGYYKLMTQSSQQDLHNLWFSNSAAFFSREIQHAFGALLGRQVLVAVVVMLLVACQRLISRQALFTRDMHDTRWTTALATFVLLGVIACGISVSLLVAPSFSDRNLLTCAPFAWFLLGRLFDVAGPRGRGRASVIFAVLTVLLVGSYLVPLRGRLLPRTEDWRASARYVQQLPGCGDQVLPVILPYRFGHATPFFRTLAEHDFYGHYLPASTAVHAYTPAEFGGRSQAAGLGELLAARAANAGTNACALLAWGVHDLDETAAIKVAMDLARQPGVAPRRILIQEFQSYHIKRLSWRPAPTAYLFIAIPPAPPGPRVLPPPSPDVRLSHADAAMLSNRIVVDYLTEYAGTAGGAYQLDTYSVQQWTPKGHTEDFVTVQRLTCNAPVVATRIEVWPDPSYPGCSNRPPPYLSSKPL